MGKREVTGTVSGKGGGLMYIHGLIDSNCPGSNHHDRGGGVLLKKEVNIALYRAAEPESAAWQLIGGYTGRKNGTTCSLKC